MSRTLITGGSGFLGINLVRHLLREGRDNLVVLDVADFNYPEADRIRFARGDIRDPDAVSRAMKDVDVVVHAAAALPLYSRRDIHTTDVEGTRNVLDAALKHGVSRFVHISSTAVYGVPDHHPVMEDDRLIGVGPYGRAKIAAERVVLEGRARGLCAPILRPKSFVGPERLGVFSLLYQWAREGRSFPMVGRGDNRYQLLDVEDLCRAIQCCVTGEVRHVDDTFNIGAEVFGTMRQDFQAVLDYAGQGGRIIGFPAWLATTALRSLSLLGLSPLYPWVYETAGKDSFVSIARAKEKLGFTPRYSNTEALIRNFQWYLDNVGRFEQTQGITHRVPWKQGVLGLVRRLF